jgi:geranylgeranyl diphosphate synthase type I
MTTVPPFLTETDTAVRPVLRAALDRIDPRTRLTAGYQLGWWDTAGRPTPRGGGKGLRPALVLLSARAAGGAPGDGLPGAAAVELVHTFSLLHDDVMDGDRERRHRPTAWAAFGLGPAILAGDALLALAGELLAEVPGEAGPAAGRCLARAVRRLIAGQAADVAFAGRSEVSLAECLAMARDKTGALLSCAAEMGALLCAGPPELTDGLARYGELLGLAFQLTDDLLGIWGEPALTGKAVLADLRERKKSVPVVRALASTGPAARQLRELYATTGDLSESDLTRAAALIEETGARDWTGKQADRLLTEALAELDRLAATPGAASLSPVRGQLTALAHFVTGRDH